MTFLRPLLVLSLILTSFSQLSGQSLIGYWHNWNAAVAPYIDIDQIDDRYDIINLSFAVPGNENDEMVFILDNAAPPRADFISQIQTLQSRGKKVLISIGGANSPVKLETEAERDNFIRTMSSIIVDFGLDGFDIDLESGSVSTTGGSITNPVDDPIINLIYAIRQIITDYADANGGEKLMLTMAPETIFVQGALSNWTGLFGAYLPIIEALREEIDFLQVQLYNTGTMFGLDRTIYASESADFIVAMTEAAIRGFVARGSGGTYSGLPASKVAVALPACPSGAGSGFTDTDTVFRAMNYLRSGLNRPGRYVLRDAAGYPDLGGMMTWSINWDAVDSCNASSYEYAANFERIFSTNVSNESELPKSLSAVTLFPNPATDLLRLNSTRPVNGSYQIVDLSGRVLRSGEVEANSIDLDGIVPGIYFLSLEGQHYKFVKSL